MKKGNDDMTLIRSWITRLNDRFPCPKSKSTPFSLIVDVGVREGVLEQVLVILLDRTAR